MEAKLILEDKQAQLDFYSFQQQLNSECLPTSPHELICPRLEFDPDRPLLDSNGRPYKFPSTLTNNAAKLASVRSRVLQHQPWQVRAVFWLMYTGRSHLGAGLLVNDMGLDKIISAICYILLIPWYDSEHAAPIQGTSVCPTLFYIYSGLDIPKPGKKGVLVRISKSASLFCPASGCPNQNVFLDRFLAISAICTDHST